MLLMPLMRADLDLKDLIIKEVFASTNSMGSQKLRETTVR